MVAGNALFDAAFADEMDVPAPVLDAEIADGEAEGRADPGKRVDHCADESAVAEPGGGAEIDRVDDGLGFVAGENRGGALAADELRRLN